MQKRETRIQYAKDRAANRAPPTLEPIALDELCRAQADVATLPVDEPVFEALADLQLNLENVGVVVSDRTIGKCYGILRAYAWLDGDSGVGLEHLEALRHVLWNDPAEIQAVEAALGAVSKGIVGEIRSIVEVATRDFYAARKAFQNGVWSSPEAKRAYEEHCIEYMDACQAAAQVIKQKFGGQVPARVKLRAQDYMNELRTVYAQAKEDTNLKL